MKVEVNPKDTVRGVAFELWMSSPMPMVTLTKTFNVSKVLRASKKLSVCFNALLCWCIAKAASQMELFYLLPEHLTIGTMLASESCLIQMIEPNNYGRI